MAANAPIEINLETIPAGFYILEITVDKSKVENHKLTIIH